MMRMPAVLVFVLAATCASCRLCAPDGDVLSVRHAPQENPVAQGEEKLPRSQPPVPDGFKELPYQETNPAPLPLPEEAERGYILFTRPITEIVYPNSRPLPSERVGSLFGFASQNEFEPLNVCVYPLRQIRKMRVSISSLENKEKGAVIPPENIDIRLLTYWNIRYPSYQSTCKTYRRMPELLEKVTACDSAASECLRYWVTMKTPSDCPPGVYRGELRLQDEGFDKAVLVPVAFRVFNFTLQKDPTKHFSAYTSVDLFQKYAKAESQQEKEFWRKAACTEYASMRDYGFDTAPFLRLLYDDIGDKLRLPADGLEIEALSGQGLNRLVPVGLDYATQALYAKHTGVGELKKWKVPACPAPEFFEHLSRLVRTFDAERRQRGWPEFIYSPADEIDTQSAEFGMRCYKAVKDAGCRTFITKDPVARVAEANMYKNHVDMWCSQPFSLDYGAVRQSGKEFWCYPNLISGEIRKPEVMCQGGRMTYGFGFWKSGYSMLIPWAWRGTPKAVFDFSYLNPDKSSPCGNRIDEKGEFIPAVYWDCFREGYDDGRYLYTLQFALSQREGTKDKECGAKVEEAKLLLREIWNGFHAQPLYGDKNSFTSEDFAALRWRMAVLIEELLRFPATTTGLDNVPSVLDCGLAGKDKSGGKVPSPSTPETKTAMERNSEVTAVSIAPSETWKATTKESSVTNTDGDSQKKKALVFTVAVDHTADGEFDKGAYPVGWPRCELTFAGERDFYGSDGLLFNIKINSNRDEVDDDATSLVLDVAGGGKKVISRELLGNFPENTWIAARCPFGSLPPGDLRKIKTMRLIAPENRYPHGTSVSFHIDGPYLYKIVKPFAERISHPHFLLTSQPSALPVEIEAVGVSGKNALRLEARISDQTGAIVHRQELLVSDPTPKRHNLPLPEIREGQYAIDFYQDSTLEHASSFRVFDNPRGDLDGQR